MNDAQRLKLYGHLPGIPLDGASAAQLDRTLANEVLIDRKCGHPDHPDPEIAASDPDTVASALGISKDEAADAIEMHSRMLLSQQQKQAMLDSGEEATGRGSWPVGCYPDFYPDNHSVVYFVDRATFKSHYKRDVTDAEWQQTLDAKVWDRGSYKDGLWDLQTIDDCKRTFVYRNAEHAAAAGKQVGDTCNMMDTALLLMEESYRRVGCPMIEVYTGPTGSHNIHIRSERIGGSTIGIAWFNNATCGDHVNHKIDSTWFPDLHDLAYLFTHEAGHNHNLRHEFSGQDRHHSIMSYRWSGLFQGFSTGEDIFVNPRDASMPELSHQYGGGPDPVPPIDGPEPPGPETPIPGEFHGYVAPDGDIAFEGVAGPIPQDAVGKEYIIKPVRGKPEYFVLEPKRRV